ncbi:delta(14)-sterol reductase [Harpegnathos saltator]|uniref:delta(14)-sterol reductase n=1 Tax=Harpegnathos saltator TaxID=610380 RepID=UPI00058EDAF7|nr:delta(14)-sterol reductase [Harpegnathos saltator]XP_019698583.1 delta(14)-sterol reductase [Harpegnathos saltator]
MFSEGEEVLAKLPNTSEYYKGRILNVKGDQYKIKFETGAQHTVSEMDIKVERRGRTPTRISNRIAGKSPMRQRYSPSRKSPSKRSPARQSMYTPTKKLPVRNTRLAKVSLSRIDIESDNINNHKTESDMKKIDESPTETMPLQQRLDEIRTTLMRRARMSSVTKIEKERTPIVLVRDIDRAASLPIERKSYLFDYSLAERGRGYSMQRDKFQDLTKVPLPQESREEKRVTSIPVNRDKGIIRIDQPQEWGGWIGTSFLIFLLPISIILPQFLCWKGLCQSDRVQFSTDWRAYINLHGFLTYIVYLTVLACVSVVPIGKNVDGQQSKIGKLQYRINGFVSATLAVVLFGLCVYKNVPISDYILENSLQLAISGWLIGTILALGLYVKAERASIANLNIYASTNSKIYNFWQGKEINPRIGILDVKLLLIRASLIGTLIMNIAIATKAIGNVRTLNIEQLDVSTLLVISLQLFYILDGLIYEATIFTSFAVMYEGTGYMTCVSHLLYPFLPTLTTKFMLYHKLQFNYYMGIFVLIFIMGYMLYRSSNSRKDEFRKNPVSPTVPYLETIPTSRGKKLMLSGLWGYVRHPNYLGDIMMQWSIAGISLAIDLLPYYAAICCTLTLAYRAVRDNRRCQTRYGYAWEEYCSRVKYMILKCVF